jgi:hypothetical protein
MSFPFSFCPPVTITETVPGLLTKTVSGEPFAYDTEVQNGKMPPIPVLSLNRTRGMVIVFELYDVSRPVGRYNRDDKIRCREKP